MDGEKVCIKFGLITEDTDVGELVGMVMASGRSVEESAKVVFFVFNCGSLSSNFSLGLASVHTT